MKKILAVLLVCLCLSSCAPTRRYLGLESHEKTEDILFKLEKSVAEQDAALDALGIRLTGIEEALRQADQRLQNMEKRQDRSDNLLGTHFGDMDKLHETSRKLSESVDYLNQEVTVFQFGNVIQSPVEVAVRFNECYGAACMTDMAEYTTATFRGDKPKSVWVADIWNHLKKTKYALLESRVAGSKIKSDKAAVIIDGEIRTAAGKEHRKSIFYLIREDGIWRIDALVVTHEDVQVENLEL